MSVPMMWVGSQTGTKLIVGFFWWWGGAARVLLLFFFLTSLLILRGEVDIDQPLPTHPLPGIQPETGDCALTKNELAAQPAEHTGQSMASSY